jgi:hypothetical protein
MTEPIIIEVDGRNRLYTMTIDDPRFGFASNGESAVAILPTVAGTGLGTPTFDVGYNIPKADKYEWSIPPQVGSKPDFAYWPEGPANVSNSESVVQSTEVTGTDNQAQTQDNHDAFISGILLGVAGGAAIAAIQEGLHMIFDNRDDSGLLKSSPSNASSYIRSRCRPRRHPRPARRGRLRYPVALVGVDECPSGQVPVLCCSVLADGDLELCPVPSRAGVG